MLLLVDLKVLATRLQPLPHKRKVIFWLDNKEINYQRLEDMIDALLDLLSPLFVDIHTHFLDYN